MRLKASLITLTLTILTALDAIPSLPIESDSPNVSHSNQNFAAPALAGTPLSRPQSDVQNQTPSRFNTRHDTQVRPIMPEAHVNSVSSQVSNVRPASEGLFNNGASLAAWANSKPADPARNVHPRQPMIEHPDHLVEGSGVGPPPSMETHKSKLDDTDDSGDDGDDEDYDDGDSPHGSIDQVGHVSATGQRPNISGSVVSAENKPDYNSFYKPFRPAPPTSSNMIPMNNQTRLTTSPPNFIQPTLPPIPVLQPSASKQPMSNATYSSAVPTQKFPSVGRNKTETDYDYVDENDDDGMEDTSVFEDNDNDEPEITANKTQPSPIHISPSLTTQPINQTKHGSPSGLLPNTPRQDESLAKLSPDIARPARPDIFSPPVVKQNTTTAGKPIMEQVRPTNKPDNEDDSEEEEEEVEEEEVEEDDDEMEDDLGDEAPTENPTPLPPRPTSPAIVLSTRPPMTNLNIIANNQANQNRPPIAGPQDNTLKPAVPQAIPNSSLGSRQPGSTPTIGQSVQSSVTIASLDLSKVSVWPGVGSSTTSMPAVISPTSITTPRPTIQPIDLSTTIKPPIYSNLPTVAHQPEGTSSRQTTTPPSVPIYFPTTLRPFFTSPPNPTRRLVPKVTTNVEPYHPVDTNLGNSDDSLTRQIYDKAKEAYFEADKTFRAAVDAVWPPNFNLDSNSLEPLLAQPVFFMLALGGAIICLVLLMMLVVYMISYQTKPRRYEPDDISIY